MGDRNASEQRRRDRAGESGNDLARDASGSQRERFLSTAAEHKWIAAFQPNDLMATTRLANHQPIDRVLRNRRPPGPLSNEESPRTRRKPQRLGIDQRVVENEIRRLEPLD